VFVVGDGNRVDPTPVQVDLETADRAAITGGVRPGALVVIGTHEPLKPGTVVAPKVAARTAEGAK
jgi:hypothetical protein